MADVDPFIQPIPDKFMQDPVLRAYFEYLHNHLFQQWVRTGGGDDQVSNLGTRELYPWGKTSAEEEQDFIGLFKAAQTSAAASSAEKEFYSISSAHTTAGNEIIEATAELTVTLNTSPDLLECVTVKRNGSGVVTVSGTIDGNSEFKLLYDLESIDLIYTGSYWLII